LITSLPEFCSATVSGERNRISGENHRCSTNS